MFNQLTTSQPQFCPFKGCPHHHRSKQAIGWTDNGKTLSNHLRTLHPNELSQLPSSLLDGLGLEICKRCEKSVYATPGLLNRHIKSQHVTTRSKSNLDILTATLFTKKATSESNQWESGLAWLLHLYKPHPPPFRQSLLLHLNHKPLEAVLDAYQDLITATVEASRVPKNLKDEKLECYNSKPFWLLSILFEQLVLAPRPSTIDDSPHAESLTQCIYRRLRWFRAGRVKDLYEESRKVVSKPPAVLLGPQASSSSTSEKSAQLAADNDNFGTANARLTKNTPVSRVFDGPDGNLESLYKLHPKEVYSSSRRRSSRRKAQRYRNTNEFVFTAASIVKDLLHLKKGKAPGLQVDSLDIFIHLAKRCRNLNAKKKLKPFASALASFFTLVANGDCPEDIQAIFRTTYLVALEKDPNDHTKLRPLGIPAAIRRIAANAIANECRSEFASYLLPYNYAVGIHGGIDFVTSSLRLGVEKYMKNQESVGLLPTRALVSLDIRNMFNAISRHKLREIVAEEFPRLQPFVDSLYEKEGQSCVKLDDGTWENIPVREGFSQGCPLSPILAAVVLNHILKKVDAKLRKISSTRSKLDSDDELGGIALIMAYVDDANFLVPLEDVLPLLNAFNEVAEPLGAVMNTEKTRIMTSTTGKSILERLEKEDKATHDSLSEAINQFSRTSNADGSTSSYEETNGLRILGVPIGSDDFCSEFHLKQVLKAAVDSNKILDGLHDKQTMLRIFKTCTLHKVTHLFASDVACTKESSLPEDWNLWSSNMTNAFSTMLNSFLERLLGVKSIPAHSHIIATTSLSNGGLGLQHPRLAAISSFMLSTKRAIDFSTNGIFLPFTPSAITLPPSITSLYSNWDSPSPNSRVFSTFNKYLPSIVSTVIHEDPSLHDSITPNDTAAFIHRTSLPWARDLLKHHASELYIDHLADTAPTNVFHALPGLLQQHMSLPLVAMSRSNPKHRLDNEAFDLALKCKLRVAIYPEQSRPKCWCGARIDCDGDHFFTCGEFPKTRCSNQCRDVTLGVMKRIVPTAQYCKSKDDVDKERHGRVKEAASKRPFDWSFDVNHITAARHKDATHLSEIGFDVTVISPSSPSDLDQNANPQNNSIELLEKGEKGKFLRDGADSDKESGMTFSGDQFIGKLYDANKALLPQSMDRWGDMGPISKRFFLGDRSAPAVFDYPADKPNAKKMHARAVSLDVPYGILNTANKVWQDSNPDMWYGDTYMEAAPKTWALQQLGLGFTKAITSHFIAADKRIHNPNAKSIYKRRRRNNHGVHVVALVEDSQPSPKPNTPSPPQLLPIDEAGPSYSHLMAPTNPNNDECLLTNLGLS